MSDEMGKDDRPLVSVVIPVFNIEPSFSFLRDAVMSVFRQTHGNVEILVVDDGSSDGTHELVSKLAADWKSRGQILEYERLSENSGPSVARNTGVNKARGAYVSFLDYDDLYLPTFLEKALAQFAADDQLFVVLAPAFFYIEYLKLEKVYSSLLPPDINSMSFSSLCSYLVENNYPVPMGSGVVCKKVLFEESPETLFDEFLSKRTAEDIDFGFNLLAHEIRPYFLAEPLVIHRSHLAHASRGRSAILKCDELEVQRYLLEHCVNKVVDTAAIEHPEDRARFEDHFQCQRRIFELKKLLLENRVLASVSYALSQPGLGKVWFRYLLLRYSCLAPLAVLRDLYYFFTAPCDRSAKGEVVSYLQALR